MSTVDIHTLAGPYALDAVDELEGVRFARHLAECESCSAEVAELRETVARLADLSEEAPPARLRGAVLAEVARTRQASPGTNGVKGRSGGGWRRGLLAAAAAVAIAVGVGAGSWVVATNRAEDDQRAVVAEQAQIREVLTAPDARITRVEVPGGGRVTAVMSASRNEGVLAVSDLAAPPAGKVYQLWLIDNGTARSAGAMEPGQRDTVRLVTDVTGADTLGVTVETAPGASQPDLDAGVVMAPLV